MTIRTLMLCACAALLVGAAGSVSAGPNEGGALILHANPSLTFTSDISDYCGMADLDSCSHAVTSVAWEPGKKTVFHALAAFPPGSSPRLKGISFGISYDPAKFILAARGSCADFELPDGAWPASGTGTAQTWTTETQTGVLTECYWFCGYAYAEDEQAPDSTIVELIPHPLHGGWFIDDSFPAEEDTVAGYGALGFGRAGLLPCPTGGGGGDEPDGGGTALSPGVQGLSFVEMATSTAQEYIDGYRALEREYGIDIAVGLSPDGLFCRLTEEQRLALTQDPRVVVATSQTLWDVIPDLRPGQPRFAELVWNELLTSPAPEPNKSGGGGPIDPPLVPDSVEVLPDRDPNAQTSIYMLGEVGVSLLFVESGNDSLCDRGNGVYTENWLEDNPFELIHAQAEVFAALEALEHQGPGDNLAFHVVDVDTCLTHPEDEEPIRAPYDQSWKVHALQDFDPTLAETSATAMARELNNKRRKDTGFDWWFTTFVVRSICDPDSSFPGDSYGYSSAWYGPWAMVCYPPRTRSMGYCLAHEICHVFGAADEYEGDSDSTGVSCDDAYGYLRWGNHNSLGRPGDQWCHDHEDCIMNADWGCWTLCEDSRRHVGWWDRDEDGIFDPLDHPYSGTSALIGGVAGDSIVLGDQIDITNVHNVFYKRLVASHWSMDQGYVLWDGIHWRGGSSNAGPWLWSRNGGPSHPMTLINDSGAPEILDLRVDPDPAHPGYDVLSLRFVDEDTHAGRVRAIVAPQFGGPYWVFKDELRLQTPEGTPPVTRAFQMDPGSGQQDTLRVLVWDVGDTDGGNIDGDSVLFIPVSSVPDAHLLVPELGLSLGRPNPSAQWVTWELHRSTAGRVDLAVIGVDGRRQKSWPGRQIASGMTRFLWDGRDDRGLRVPSGRYFLVCTDERGRVVSRHATIVR